jgi:hypothetical protein
LAPTLKHERRSRYRVHGKADCPEIGNLWPLTIAG